MAADTIPHRLLNRAKSTPNAPAYYVRESGAWKPTNWGTYSDQVTQAGRALIALGFEPGQTACILGQGRALGGQAKQPRHRAEILDVQWLHRSRR